MNPFAPWMIGLPALLSVAASMTAKRPIKWALLILATFVYWFILQKYVDWAFNHPFNPNDGGPRATAYLVGWLVGLMTVVIPAYWISKGVQRLVRKSK